MSEQQPPMSPLRLAWLLYSKPDRLVQRSYSLQQRDGTTRMTLIREAHDDSANDDVTQWYYPKQHCIVIDLDEDR